MRRHPADPLALSHALIHTTSDAARGYVADGRAQTVPLTWHLQKAGS
jgi:hypothetical protein